MPAPQQDLGLPQEVAEYLRVSVQALADMRYRSAGPPYIKLGRLIRYDWPAVLMWQTGQTHGATDTT